MLKEFKAVDSIATEHLNKNAAEMEDARAKIAEYEKIAADCQEIIENSINAGDEKTYKDAKRRGSEAVDLAEMNRQRLKRLETEPLISREEYNTLCARVMSATDEKYKEAQKDLADLAEKMQERGEKIKTVLDDCNALLKRLQVDLFKYSDASRMAGGLVISGKKEYPLDAVYYWSRCAVENYGYEEYQDMSTK